MPPKIKKGMWINEAVVEAMDDIERGTHTIRRANKSWNIPMSSLVNHLNEKPDLGKWGQEVCLHKKKM
jgi:hypothetical protein